MTDRHSESRRRANTPARRWPLALPHHHIRRIINRNATVLILTRKATPGLHELQDALVIRRNQAHRRRGRPDLQENPVALTVEITGVQVVPFGEVDFATVRAAGFKTTDEMHEDWAGRRRSLDPSALVHVCVFHVTEARYLHRLVHRGYTNDLSEAVEGEGEAVSEATQDRFSDVARERFREDHAVEFARREARALANQLREAQRRAVLSGVDISPEVGLIRAQLERIRSKTEDVAA